MYLLKNLNPTIVHNHTESCRLYTPATPMLARGGGTHREIARACWQSASPKLSEFRVQKRNVHLLKGARQRIEANTTYKFEHALPLT